MAETIGTLVDKISIFELKIYHMDEQTRRKDASSDHIKSCRKKIRILKAQRDDLVAELNELFEDVKTGKKKLRIYRQFKMYNDPAYRGK